MNLRYVVAFFTRLATVLSRWETICSLAILVIGGEIAIIRASTKGDKDKKMAEGGNERMDKLVALCKRRGFIFQSSEIYGGIGGFWDYGPLGVELKRNIKAAWWEDVVRKRDDMVGLDCSIIMNPKVWEASGHVGGFSDPRIDCKECQSRFRADKIFSVTASVGDNVLLSASIEADGAEEAKRAAIESANSKVRRRLNQQGDKLAWGIVRGDKDGGEFICPKCAGELTDARDFNLMFESNAGALKDAASKVYLRPETAQGIFCNFKNVLDTQRLKLPFGIAQVGKSFRNEINPRNYTFRSREVEQMEIEFFCHPDQADKWYEYWRDARYQWYIDHGLTSSKLHLRDHDKDELAHYARACADIEYEFPFGVSELEGVANRTDFDLAQHQKFSGRDQTYFDDDAWREDAGNFSADKFDGDKKAAKQAAAEAKQNLPYRFLPHVIEPSGGVDRAMLAFLCEAYCEDEAPNDKGEMQTRVVMKLHPRLAPIKAAVFPLVKKEGMPEKAREIYDALKSAGLAAFYDEKGAVGRRYRRQDEAGTPFCITVDGQTIEDGTVTIRDRDSLSQERIPADSVAGHVQQRVS